MNVSFTGSLKTKVALWSGISILVTAGIIIFHSVLSLREAAISSARNNMIAMAREVSSVENEISSALDAARNISNILDRIKNPDNPVDMQRFEVVDMLLHFLEDQPDFSGLFTVWEPNAFDGLDIGFSEERGHDASGRFAPLWQRKGDIFELHSVFESNIQCPDGKLGEWYQLIKNHKREYIGDPVLYEGPDKNILQVSTAIVPILVRGKFFGVVGVEQDMTFLQTMADELNFYGVTGRMVIVSHQGSIVGLTGDKSWLGKNISEFLSGSDDILAQIKTGEEFLDFNSGLFYAFSPVQVGKTSKPWSVGIISPAKHLTEDVTAKIWKEISLFAVILLVMISLSVLVTRRMTGHLSQLLAAMSRVKDGELNHTVEIKSNDEIGQVAEIFNEMTAKLRENMDALADHQEKLEDTVKQRTKELKIAYDNLKATQAQLLHKEKMASIGQLAAGVAHEVNNPIGFVKSNLGALDKYLHRLNDYVDIQGSMLAELADDEQTKELKKHRRKLKIDLVQDDATSLVEESMDGVDRVKEIVQSLKDFSRVDQADFQKVDINQCLDETVMIMSKDLDDKATMHKKYGDLPLTICSPQQLNQAFMNILLNAAQAIEEKGTITLNTWLGGDSIFISIADTGVGIAEEDISRLFDPFFTTNDVGEGTGLGLSIVYDIITKEHKGEISVESEPGTGSIFTIRLPVVDRLAD